jgi:hypothetical protein
MKPDPEPPPKPGYEQRDVHVPWLFFAAIGVLLSCALIQVGVFLMYRGMRHGRQEADRLNENYTVAPSVSAAAEPQWFPGPRLQTAPEVDLATFRAREDEELNNYAWIDRRAGVVRIPIALAMNLIAQRGLPYRGQPGAPPPARTVLEMQQARPSDWSRQQQSDQTLPWQPVQVPVSGTATPELPLK